MSAPTFLIGSSIQDWHAIGVTARSSFEDAHGRVATPRDAIIAWLFVEGNPEMFGDCEEWPAAFPDRMPVYFRMGFNEVAA
jgi:hypothetical protein